MTEDAMKKLLDYKDNILLIKTYYINGEIVNVNGVMLLKQKEEGINERIK